MTAFDFSCDEAGTITAVIGEPDACFLCGGPIDGWAVYWIGAPGTLFLHQHCARKLGSYLIADGFVGLPRPQAKPPCIKYSAMRKKLSA